MKTSVYLGTPQESPGGHHGTSYTLRWTLHSANETRLFGLGHEARGGEAEQGRARADVADPRPGSGRPGPGPASAVAQLRGFRHIASVFTSKTGSMKCHPYWIIVRTEMRWHL